MRSRRWARERGGEGEGTAASGPAGEGTEGAICTGCASVLQWFQGKATQPYLPRPQDIIRYLTIRGLPRT